MSVCRWMSWAVLASLSPALAAETTCPPPAAWTALRSQILQAPRYQLANGASLTVLPDATAQSAAVAVGIAVGSRNERDGEHGFAHLLEHMLFTGSDNLPPGAWENALRSRGGNANASTGFESTVYYSNSAASQWPSLLWLHADALLRPLFSEDSLSAQKQAVREEMRLRVEQPPYVGPAMSAALAQFSGTGWGHPVIGTPASVFAATRDSLKTFWQLHYGARRQHWVVAGPMAPAEVQQAWSRALQPHPAGSADPAEQPLPERHFRLNVTDPRAPWPVQVWGWYLPSADRPEGRAAQLAFARLFDATHGSLMQELRAHRRVFLAYSQTLNLPGNSIGMLALVPRASSTPAQLTEALRHALQSAAASPLDDSARCALQQQHWLAELEALHTPLEQAGWLAGLLANGRSAADALSPELPDAAALAAAQTALATAPDTGMDLYPVWYMRWLKAVLQALPDSWVESLEENLL